jgi:ABC-2 type transport system ATP-binding protein
MSTRAAITVDSLRKSYKGVEAVRDVSFRVEWGEVFAFLGPNGAGKTTTVEILEGYRDRDGGSVDVLGEDPSKGGRKWRERIGIVLQSCRMEPEHSVHETMRLFSGYYRTPRPIDDILEIVGLIAQRDRRVGKLSGGQQRRLDVGLALLGDPDLLFLDEPTTGFDPTARRDAWDMLRGLRDQGTTIFLTTHYMEEAQVLADRAAIIVDGRILANGSPSDLIADQAAATEIVFRIPASVDASGLRLALGAQVDGGRVSLSTSAPDEALELLSTWAGQQGVELAELEVKRATLEDVFLDLTRQS